MADRHAPYHLLLDAFAEQGCPVCALVEGTVRRYLDMLIYEHVNDVEMRAELRRAGGFCNTHGWWLVTRQRGAALGVAIIYRDVLHTLRERLEHVSGSGHLLGGRRWPRMPFGGNPGAGADPHVDCPACAIRARDEAVFLGTLVDHAGEWQFMERYAASSGLCFVHLDQALARCRDERAARALLEVQGTIADRLIAELDEFQRKNDYRFRDEPLGREATAWQRAIEMVSGKEGAR